MATTGNPLLDNPATKAALIASMQAPPPPQGAIMPPAGASQPPQLTGLRQPAPQEPQGAISMPQGPMPSMPSTPSPQVKAPRGTSTGDEAELSRKLSTRSGISQIAGKVEGSRLGQAHPMLGKILGIGAQGLAQIGDLGLSALAPRLAAEIPGTSLHHMAGVRGDQRQVAEDVANEGKQAQTQAIPAETQLKGAQAREAEARADALENPAEKPDKYTYQQTDHGLMRIDSVTGEATPVTYQGQPLKPFEKPGSEKGMEGKAVLDDNGKPIEANYNPATGQYTDTAGNPIKNPRPVPPPPSYGQLILPSKTTTFIDPNTGVPTEFQYNPKTQSYDKPVGTSATGGYGHEAAQAGAVTRAGAQLIRDIEANRAELGTLGTWVSKYGLNTPIADPKLARLQSEMASFAALNPAMHGARGLHAMEHFERLVGGLQQNPDASIEGIRGIIQTAGEINPNLQENKQPAASAPPAGADVKVPGKDGKMYWGNSKTKQILGPA